MIQFIAFGIIIDDIVFPQGHTRMGVLGGGGPQTAWGMAAAEAAVHGSSERVGLVAGVGADLDRVTLEPMRAAGINLDGVRVTGQPTLRAWQVVEFDGKRRQLWRVPVEVLGEQLARNLDLLPDSYQSAQGFHWGIHPDDASALDFARTLEARGAHVSLETFKPSARPLSDDDLHAILSACTVFSPNWYEAQRITGHDQADAVIGRFRDLGARVLAMRRGADGADVWDFRAGHGVHVPAVATSVVDVVGAGNAFCGALLAQLDEGIEVASCHASAAASYLVEQVGLPDRLPDPADYMRRLEEARAGLRTLQPGT